MTRKKTESNIASARRDAIRARARVRVAQSLKSTLNSYAQIKFSKGNNQEDMD